MPDEIDVEAIAGGETYTGGELPPESVAPRERAGRKPGSKNKKATKRRTKEEQEETVQKTRDSIQMTYEEWIETFDWTGPNMRCRVARLAPKTWNLNGKAIQVGGNLEARPTPYGMDEIAARWGGGTYEVWVIGSPALGEKVRAFGRKRVEIAGEPKMTDDALPEHVRDRLGGVSLQQIAPAGGAAAGGSGGMDTMAAQAQAGVVGILGDVVKSSLEGGGGHGNVDPDILQQVRESVERSANAQVETIRTSAEAQVESMRRQLDELREETSKLRAERETYAAQTQNEVTAARGEANNFVATLLPAMTGNANEQARLAVEQANAHVARIQEQMRRDLESEQRRFEMQLAQSQTLYQATATNQETIYKGQIAALQTQLAGMQQRNEALEADNRRLRDEITATHKEYAIKKSPQAQMEESLGLVELAKTLAGGGGGDEDDMEGMPAWAKMATKFAPGLNAGLQAVAAKMGVMPQGEAEPQMTPQQHQQHQMMLAHQQQQMQMQQAAAPQALVPVAAPQAVQPRPVVQPQQPPPAPKPRVVRKRRSEDAVISRSDLEQGVQLLELGMVGGTPPAEAANIAAQQMDRGVLKALARRPHRQVVQSLHAAGLLNQVMASQEGVVYICAVLDALKQQLLAPQRVPADAVPAGSGPEQVPEPTVPEETEEAPAEQEPPDDA